jgi:hypothetical protein
MMEGKAYSRILQALLLLDCALHNIMVNTYFESSSLEDNSMSDKGIEVVTLQGDCDENSDYDDTAENGVT